MTEVAVLAVSVVAVSIPVLLGLALARAAALGDRQRTTVLDVLRDEDR